MYKRQKIFIFFSLKKKKKKKKKKKDGPKQEVAQGRVSSSTTYEEASNQISVNESL